MTRPSAEISTPAPVSLKEAMAPVWDETSVPLVRMTATEGSTFLKTSPTGT